MELALRLDVGCGSRPHGDVNVDFFRRGWNRQEGDQDKGEYVNHHSIPNFVVASAEALPFRSGFLMWLIVATRLSTCITHLKCLVNWSGLASVR